MPHSRRQQYHADHERQQEARAVAVKSLETTDAPTKPSVEHAPDLNRFVKRHDPPPDARPNSQQRRAARDRSYAALLDRLYEQFDDLAEEIAHSTDMAPERKADALAKLSRTLPLLQQAERNASVKAKGKAVEAMTDDELAREVKRIQRLGAGGPSREGRVSKRKGDGDGDGDA